MLSGMEGEGVGWEREEGGLVEVGGVGGGGGGWEDWGMGKEKGSKEGVGLVG